MRQLAEGRILIEQDGPVTIVTINRPQVRNALDHAGAEGLAEAFAAFEADDERRVAVLTGAGGAFCAGADLKQMASDVEYKAWAGHPEGPLHAVPSKPVIAAVAGHAVAGGLGVALWCDIRVVDETAVFGVFCRRYGVPMSDGSTVRLPRLIGMGRALDMLITGRPVNAQDALSWGLATRLVPAGTAREAAVELAHQVAAFPQIAMRSDRLSAHEQNGLDLAQALAREMAHAEAAKRLEAQAGAQRFAAGAGRHGAFGED